MKVLEFFLVAYLALFWCLLAVLYLVVSIPVFLFSDSKGSLLPPTPFSTFPTDALDETSTEVIRR